MCMCVSERKRERERDRKGGLGRDRERERKRERRCVCERKCERERGRDRGRCCITTADNNKMMHPQRAFSSNWNALTLSSFSSSSSFSFSSLPMTNSRKPVPLNKWRHPRPHHPSQQVQSVHTVYTTRLPHTATDHRCTRIELN